MKSFAVITSILLSLSSVAHAYPWMADPNLKLEKREEKRLLGLVPGPSAPSSGGTLGNILGGLAGPGGLLEGLLGSLAQGVNPNDKRPDVDHPFIAPGPTDQRGPCPGLNTLANHGYLPRNGIVTAGQVIEATSNGFNMATDLSTLLIVIAVTFGGNLETETFSLGGEDDRTYSASGIGSKAAGRQYGLDGHSRCEGDSSALRRDYYLNNGDNHNAYPDRFRRWIKYAKESGGQFDVASANKLFAENQAESVAQNPRLYYQAYTIIVFLGEYPFLLNFFSNGTYGAGGTANYESISSLVGMQTNADGSICYVPERFPDNWYRRSSPYGVTELVDNLLPTYLASGLSPLPNPLNILQNGAAAPQIGCAIYQGITSGIPASLLGSTNDYISAAESYVQRRLFPTIPPLYGCNPAQWTLQENATNGGQYETPTSGVSQGYNICG